MAEHSDKTMQVVAAVEALYRGNTFAPDKATLAQAIGRIVDAPEPAPPEPPAVEEPESE